MAAKTRRLASQTDKKPKPINYSLVEDRDIPGTIGPTNPYPILRDLVAKHHPHLADATIAIAWRYGWAEDKDGLLILGQCKKASDLSRELVDYDFVILLNYETWKSPEFSDQQRRALMDHELCHAQVSKGKDGEDRYDDRGRLVYRIRKHDVEEFNEIVKRHGIWKSNLQEFAKSIRDKSKAPLLEKMAKS